MGYYILSWAQQCPPQSFIQDLCMGSFWGKGLCWWWWWWLVLPGWATVACEPSLWACLGGILSMVSSRFYAQHRADPPSPVGVGTLCRRERQRKGWIPLPLLGAGRPSIHFALSASEPLVLELWTQAPLLWDHGEILVVQGEQLEQGMGDLGDSLTISQCWCMC